MIISKGQALLLKLPYADGGVCKKKRPFLVIEVLNDSCYLLNISSVKGKFRKLQFKSNILINKYNPPFIKPSFVKIDAVYKLDYFPELTKSILNSGNKLNEKDFDNIKNKLISFKANNNVLSKSFTAEEIKQFNSNLN
ncbi:MAG: hypothetical protein ACOCRK_10450 [bacterium]